MQMRVVNTDLNNNKFKSIALLLAVAVAMHSFNSY